MLQQTRYFNIKFGIVLQRSITKKKSKTKKTYLKKVQI